jgi:polyphosphate kinase 2 (PPK2 family)
MPRTASRSSTGRQPRKRPSGIERKKFESAIEKLHVELVKLQLWVRHKGLKVVIIFEGRDAAGKGGIIKRITEEWLQRAGPTLQPRARHSLNCEWLANLNRYHITPRRSELI